MAGRIKTNSRGGRGLSGTNKLEGKLSSGSEWDKVLSAKKLGAENERSERDIQKAKKSG